MFRRIWVAGVVIASVITLGGVAQGRGVHPNLVPSGVINCTQESGTAAFSGLGLSNVVPPAGGFNATLQGTFSGCTGNAGNVVMGGYFTGVLKAPAGPRTCTAGGLTATYTGANALTVHWFTINAGTGLVTDFISTSNAMTIASGTYPPFTVQFMIGAGPFVGSTITFAGNFTEPVPASFVVDCTTAVPVTRLRGDGGTGTVSVP
jgi:hypothetical protein